MIIENTILTCHNCASTIQPSSLTERMIRRHVTPVEIGSMESRSEWQWRCPACHYWTTIIPEKTMQRQNDMNKTEADFISSFNALSQRNHAAMVKQGFWKDRHALLAAAGSVSPELERYARIAITGMGIALKHSELSEALEGIRHGNPPDDKVPEFTSEESEYADTIIRIFDTAGERKLRVAEAVIAKMAMNEKREPMHGKLA